MKKNLAKATALLLTAGMIGGTGLTAAASDVELNPAGTYPVVKDGTLEFDCFTMSMPNVEDLQTNDFTKYMEEKTGITMNFLTGGRDDWSDKLNLMLQSGDYPDVILGVSPDEKHIVNIHCMTVDKGWLWAFVENKDGEIKLIKAGI